MGRGRRGQEKKGRNGADPRGLVCVPLLRPQVRPICRTRRRAVHSRSPTLEGAPAHTAVPQTLALVSSLQGAAGGAITGAAGAPQRDAQGAGGELRGLGADGPGWRRVFSVHLGKRPHLLQIRRAPFALGILERVLPLIQRSLQNHLSGRPGVRFLRIGISALPFAV